MSTLSVDHLLGTKYLNKSDINLIFRTADNFKKIINQSIKKVPSLRDITIAKCGEEYWNCEEDCQSCYEECGECD